MNAIKQAEPRGNAGSSPRHPIRVCEVVCNLIDGGVESMLLNYLSHMDLSKFELHVVTYSVDSPGCRVKFEQLGCRVHVIPPKREGFFISLRAMANVIKEIHPDVVHSHLTDWNGLAALCARGCRVPRIIVHSHLSMPETPRPLHGVLCALGKACATDLIACSDFAAENMYGKHWASSGKVLVLNNAILAEKYRFNDGARQTLRSRAGCSGSETIVGHVGRLTAQKNHPFLVRAFFEYKKNYDPTAKLLLFGRGEDEGAVTSLIERLGLSDAVVLMGTTPDIAMWYSAFDIFVLPSLYEGLPVSAVEAQANGVPTLLSSEITREVAFGKNVMFSGIDDPASWASDMNRCLGLGRSDHPDLPDEFDIEAQAMRLEQIYAG